MCFKNCAFSLGSKDPSTSRASQFEEFEDLNAFVDCPTVASQRVVKECGCLAKSAITIQQRVSTM